MTNYLQFQLEVENNEEKERLIALLAAQGFEGFDETSGNLDAFIPEPAFDEEKFSDVIGMFPALVYIRSTVENVNWNQKWEEAFKPVTINRFVGIRADFHPPFSDVLHEIVITPKMSFGTGHHATTYLVINEMQSHDFTGRSVLDFGTGTGILGILASKMGATDVLAIDYDEWSILNAGENIKRNDCTGIWVEQADTVPANRQFDFILANINLNVILSSLTSIANCCIPGTIIFLSGFLKENEAEINTAIGHAGLQYITTSQRLDWILVVAKKL